MDYNFGVGTAADPIEPVESPDRRHVSQPRTARNRYGGVKRQHPHDEQRLEDARRELAAAKIEQYIDKVLSTAPPLTDSQRQTIVGLLRGGQ